MKKELLVYAVIGLCVFLILNFHVSSREEDIIEGAIYDTLNVEQNTRVIVDLTEPSPTTGIFLKKEKTDEEIVDEKIEQKLEIIKAIGEEKVVHVFEDSIALTISQETLNVLSTLEHVQSVRIDKPINAFLENSVPLINASTVWPIQLSGINITGIDETVCVIDTGVNFTHTDLVGKNKTCIIDCEGNACVENCSIGDDNGHGTHVAGTVAAYGIIDGVGVNISIIGVKVLNSAGSGTGSDLDAGMQWCIDNAATYNISIISMSLGTNCAASPQFCYSTYCDGEASEAASAAIINNATGRNISVIAATGNNGNITHIASPACIENVTAVGRSSDDDTIHANGNRNNLTDFMAPGSSINATKTLCLSGCSCSGNYMVCSGTSMSAPHVSGAYALVRHFYRLQNASVPTPSQLFSFLNDSATFINDSSGSNLLFPRVNVYGTLLSLDATAPSVSLGIPSNATTQFSQTVNFSCLSNDAKLSNVTLYVWNSTGLHNNSKRVNSSAVQLNHTFNLTLDYGTYDWNCLAYDHTSRSSFSSSNKTITVGQITTTLNTPGNNSFVNLNQTYNCSGETEPTKLLHNMTFYFYNSSSSVLNSSTQVVRGVTNDSVFSHNFSTEGTYHWNCVTYNNNTESAFADANFSVTYDVTNPNITLVAPVNVTSYSSNSQSVTFEFNISEDNSANCSVLVNGSIEVSNSSFINQSLTQSLSSTFTPATYDWSIQCYDKAGNNATSEQRRFTVTTPPSSSSSSSGGGGGGGGGGGSVAAFSTYVVSEDQARQGKSSSLKKDDRIKFTIFDGESQQHSVTLTALSDISVTLLIESDPFSLNLGVGQSAKLNLSSSLYYDLYIKLNGIRDSKANITIQTIKERILPIAIIKDIPESENNETTVIADDQIDILNFLTGEVTRLKIIVYGFIVVFVGFILYLYVRRTFSNKNVIEEESAQKGKKEKTKRKSRKI